MIHHFLKNPGEDYAVKAAAARAAGALGSPDSLPFLAMARQYDEWCTQTEAAKATRRIQNEPPA